MKQEFIPYQQSLELKELGFNEQCFFIYTRDGSGLNRLDGPQNSKELYERTIQPNTYVVAPLYQQAFRWFREKNFMCHVTNDLSNNLQDEVYVYVMTKGYGSLIDRSEEYSTYEEAELACLKKLIEIVKNK